jgi:hypothetical protein
VRGDGLLHDGPTDPLEADHGALDGLLYGFPLVYGLAAILHFHGGTKEADSTSEVTMGGAKAAVQLNGHHCVGGLDGLSPYAPLHDGLVNPLEADHGDDTNIGGGLAPATNGRGAVEGSRPPYVNGRGGPAPLLLDHGVSLGGDDIDIRAEVLLDGLIDPRVAGGVGLLPAPYDYGGGNGIGGLAASSYQREARLRSSRAGRPCVARRARTLRSAFSAKVATQWGYSPDGHGYAVALSDDDG